jgi:hypothetical protein
VPVPLAAQADVVEFPATFSPSEDEDPDPLA